MTSPIPPKNATMPAIDRTDDDPDDQHHQQVAAELGDEGQLLVGPAARLGVQAVSGAGRRVGRPWTRAALRCFHRVPRLDAPADVHTMTSPRPRKAHAGPDGMTSAAAGGTGVAARRLRTQ